MAQLPDTPSEMVTPKISVFLTVKIRIARKILGTIKSQRVDFSRNVYHTANVVELNDARKEI